MEQAIEEEKRLLPEGDSLDLPNGYIDLLIETTNGWIIIDHKSSPAPRSEWKANTLKYSGQLDMYRKAIEKVKNKPVLGCWIHFALTGGMVEVL